jgi:hypothetical protein
MKEREVYEALLEQNGRVNQIAVAIEELAELQKELTKCLREMGSEKHVAEEVADVQVVIGQVELMFPDVKRLSRFYKRYKLARLQEVVLKRQEH